MSRWKPRLIAILLVVGTLSAIGIGMGLTGYLTADSMMGSMGSAGGGDSTAAALQQSFLQLFAIMLMFQLAIFTFFLGPMAGGLAGLVSGLIVNDWKDGALIGGVGSLVGFYPMVVLAVVIMFMSLDPSAGGGTDSSTSIDLGQALQPALLAGLPTGVVGAITGVLGTKF
ncbi:MAG: hypothetical protein ABEI31_10605 [Halodesulfurarchaeum sp.]